MASRPEFLARVPLFRQFDPEDLQHFADATTMCSFGRGENLFEVGDPGSSLHIITKGTVQVLQPGRDQLARMEVGDFIGEMAILNDAPRSATVRALDDVETLVLDKAAFRELVSTRPEVGLKLLEVMSMRIRHADEQIGGLSSEAVRDSTSGLLNRLAFDQRLEEETARSRRYGGSFALAMIDFGDLSSINDTVGFDVGDRTLAWIGRLLTEHTRASDVPFRCEPDVFVVLCPWTTAQVADVVAKRLAVLIGEAHPPVEVDLFLIPAVAWATCPDDGREAQPLYRKAVMALEAAKAAQRA
jgi:CRP/FNR family cyclic AMP-dependent transcriptional regulator